MENKRENKKFYKKIIIVLLSAWLFMLIIPLNTVVYNKDGYSYEPQNYGFKNLAMPNLEGKEYLGDGIYRFYDANGVTLTYNVYDGNYISNTTGGQSFGSLSFDVEIGKEYTLSTIYVSGSTNATYRVLVDGSYIQLDMLRNRTITFTPTTLTYITIGYGSATINENFTFKLQLEKGDTATDYEVPIEPLIYHYRNGGIKNA